MGKAKRGFTLIELMVATSLMMFLVAIVLQLTGSILTTWNRAYTKLTANFGARQAMDIMVSDLESAIVKSSSLGAANRNWIEIFISDPDDVDSDLGRFDNIFFFSPTTIRHKYYYRGNDAVPIPGDITAVAYRVIYINPLDPESEQDKRFVLYRAVIDPQVTFTDFLGVKKQEDLRDTWESGSYEEELIDEYYERQYSGSGWEYAAETMNLLALNVVALEFEPVFKNVSSNNITYQADRDMDEHILPKDAEDSNRTLHAIDITMIILSDEGEAIIRDLNNAGKLTQTRFEDIVYTRDDETGLYRLGTFAQRFKRRVPIISSPY